MARRDEAASAPVSSGVDALIERLRRDGVEKGRAEAEQILKEAERRANAILAAAEKEADEIRERAQSAAERFAASGREALEVAARDTLLTLKAQLSNRFAREVERLVSREMHSEDLLLDLIRAVVSRAVEDVAPDDRMEILLPRDVVGLEDLRRNPDELAKGELSRFVQVLTEEIAARGISFGRMEGEEGGICLRLVDKAMTIELTDQAVSALLLEHLQPRFRALLEGIVK